MKPSEFSIILAAIITLALVLGFNSVLSGNWQALPFYILCSAIIILVAIFSKKIMAHLLDADVEHEIWGFSRYGYKPENYFKKELPIGIIFPLFFSLISLGALKVPAILTYETRALKQRAAKRFGFYSYTEMTDWHNGIIGSAGIIGIFLLVIISYLLPFNLGLLAKAATYYAFFNLIPISKLDGTQIFFGSRILWTILAVISIIFTSYAIIL